MYKLSVQKMFAGILLSLLLIAAMFAHIPVNVSAQEENDNITIEKVEDTWKIISKDEDVPIHNYIDAITAIRIDGIDVSESKDSFIQEDGSINLNATVFENGNNDCYTLTINAENYPTVSNLIGDLSVVRWSQSEGWYNWCNDINSSDKNIMQTWSIIADTEEAINTYKQRWLSMCSIGYDISEIHFSSDALTATKEDGTVVMSYKYHCIEKVMNGLENGVTYLFEAEEGEKAGEFRYLAMMPPESSEGIMAGHFHFRYGAQSDLLTNEEYEWWYPTVIDNKATIAMRCNVITFMHGINVTYVSNYTELLYAIEIAEDGNIIRFTNNIEADKALDLQNKDITVDTNGYKLLVKSLEEPSAKDPSSQASSKVESGTQLVKNASNPKTGDTMQIGGLIFSACAACFVLIQLRRQKLNR